MASYDTKKANSPLSTPYSPIGYAAASPCEPHIMKARQAGLHDGWIASVTQSCASVTQAEIEALRAQPAQIEPVIVKG